MNSVFQQLSEALMPHRVALQDTIYRELCEIKRLLEHGNRISDLGKPDTGDTFHHIIVKKKLPAALKEINIGQNETDPGGPTLGEIWLVQSITVNGVPTKSPRFAIRTNTGRLIFAVLKEGMGIENVAGDVVLTQGETLTFEAEAEGEFDFTITVRQRKYMRQIADAGHGIAQGDDINLRAHSGEHEPERYIPDMAPEWQGIDVPAHLQPMSPGYGGAIDPDEIIGGEPVGVDPET